MPTPKKIKEKAEEQYLKRVVETGNLLIKYDEQFLDKILNYLNNRNNFLPPVKTLNPDSKIYYVPNFNKTGPKRNTAEGFVMLEKGYKHILVSPNFQKKHETSVKNLERIARGESIEERKVKWKI
jgi:hypothetical protein